ncbi:restriction endonuclease subunit S [Eubacterium sp.]|uniref:restriction endonuclease subunit S n=1 Tax=Eubacterium sp. TaxID=142586 RepID=UPI00399EF8F7
MICVEECCEILDSMRIPITATERKAGKYPYYGANGIQDYVSDYIFDDELVLLAEDGGNFGSKERPIAYRVSGKCWVNNHAHVLKPKKEMNVDYLCYSLMFYNVEGIINGATRQKLTQSAMRKMKIPIRGMEEQLKIVEKLNKIISIKEKRKQELQYLDECVNARFVEMFGDPVSNSYGLPEATLPELGEFGRGVSKHRPRNDPQLLGGKYPLIQTGDIANADLFISAYTSTYSEMGLKQSKMWSKGTLCITIAANIAKTAILEFDACFPDSVVGFNANEKTNNIFIHYWFSFFQAILEAQAPESAQKNINVKILSELKIILPDKGKQDEFVEFIKQIDKSKVAVQKALDEAQLLFDSLMQEYFG